MLRTLCNDAVVFLSQNEDPKLSNKIVSLRQKSYIEKMVRSVHRLKELKRYYENKDR